MNTQLEIVQQRAARKEEHLKHMDDVRHWHLSTSIVHCAPQRGN